MCMMALGTLAVPAPLNAEDPQPTVIDGRCQYNQNVTKYRAETTLIVCDNVKISRSPATATLDFTQRSWGSMAQFSGAMSGNTMTLSQITLRDGRSMAATGSCEIFLRPDGSLSVISCLGKTRSRSVAANFIPSRF